MPIEPASYGGFLIALMLCSLRISILMSVVPIFPRDIFPLSRRAILACLFSAPIVYQPMEGIRAAMPDLSYLFLLAAKEIIIGYMLGFIIAIPFYAVEASGNFIDNQRSGGMADLTNPFSRESTTPLGTFFTQCFVVYFFFEFGFHGLFSIIYESFVIWPANQLGPSLNVNMAKNYLALMDQMMTTAVLLAIPIVVVMLLGEIALGTINTFAPQLQVFVLAAPVKSIIGLAGLLVYFSVIQNHFESGPMLMLKNSLNVLLNSIAF